MAKFWSNDFSDRKIAMEYKFSKQYIIVLKRKLQPEFVKGKPLTFPNPILIANPMMKKKKRNLNQNWNNDGQ